MSGELAAARAELEAPLRAAGVDTPAPGEPWSAPCAIVRPGDPWLEPARVGPGATLGGAGGVVRNVNMSVLLIAGRADTTAALVDLERLAEAATLALAGMPGWTGPTVTAARSQLIAGAVYLVAGLSVSTIRTLERPTPSP